MNLLEIKVKLKIIKNGYNILSFFGNEKDEIHIELKVPRILGITQISTHSAFCADFMWKSTDKDFDIYFINARNFIDYNHDHEEIYFTLKSGFKNYYLDNLSKIIVDSSVQYSVTECFESRATHLFIKTLNTTAKPINGCIYQIFIDRFNKKNPRTRTDSRYNSDWENGIPEYSLFPGQFIENNTHFGGNFEGIEEKLDYLSSLSVSCIYLSPVYKSYSNHKYDVGDYLTPDENFGGEEKLIKLINECKKRGIKIILDSVFNHTGDNSKYFNKFNSYDEKGAYQSKDSKYFDWYTFNNFPNEYECWWGVKCLPSIKKGHQGFMHYICKENGVIDYYTKLGVDGLRLDVADELTIDFIKKIKIALQRNKTDGILIGEVWENAVRKIAYGEKKHYFDVGRLDSVTNYPLTNAILEFVKDGNCDRFNREISDIYTDYPYNNSLLLVNSLSTHDTFRAMSRIGAHPPLEKEKRALYKMPKKEYKEAKNKFKLAVVLQAFLPGIPCIYYGDEIGMEGLEDPFNRMPMQWNKANSELLEWHKVIMKIRKNNRPLSEGGLEIKKCENGIFVFDRFLKNERIKTIINLSEKELITKINGYDLITDKKCNIDKIKSMDCKIIKTI